MGATKRAAEKLIQSFNDISKLRLWLYVLVMFLEAQEVQSLHSKSKLMMVDQLTITHPEMTRYFMSIQEASQLILQCGALGRDGEIFLLEMGKPISIVQMAKDLIRLSGLEPDVDIPIVFTGLETRRKAL